jgi:hypothetical protein
MINKDYISVEAPMVTKRTHFWNILWLSGIVLVAVAIVVGLVISVPKAADLNNSAEAFSDQPESPVDSFDKEVREGISLTSGLPLDERVVIEDPPAESQLPIIPEPIVRVSNGTAVELRSVQMGDKYLEAAICFQQPTTDIAWYPGNSASDVFMTVEDTVIPIWGYNLLDWQVTEEGKILSRCDKLLFPVATDQELRNFTITIKRLVTDIPEQPDCEAAQQKLADHEVVIQCDHGDNSFSYAVVEKPTALTDSQIHDLVNESFMETLNGPWVFMIGEQ